MITWCSSFPFSMHNFLACCQGRKPVFIPFSDTECVILECVLSWGNLFHLLTIWANTLHSSQATWSFRSPAPTLILPCTNLPYPSPPYPTLPYPVKSILTYCNFRYVLLRGFEGGTLFWLQQFVVIADLLLFRWVKTSWFPSKKEPNTWGSTMLK